MASTLVLMFPGQGSQKPGMGADFFDLPSTAEILDTVSDAVGSNVKSLLTETDEDTLRETDNAQLALYTCGVLAGKALLADPGVRSQVLAMAGHSIGEYAALAVSEAISIEDGAKLVQQRGFLMANAGANRSGAMSAILGLEREQLEAVCRAASTDGEVATIANDNCPGQIVISGDTAAVRRADELAKEAGAKRALPLNVSGAFHSPLMAESAREMRKALDEVDFAKGFAPIVSNVTAQAVRDASQWPSLLEQQLENPVRWTESVQALSAMGATIYIECGVGEVLCGLVKRTIKDATTMAVHDLMSLEKAKGALGVAHAV
ncbi:MAG: ACP S-malonyltransferase [Armatimonadetes bacterium]|nr:ACP S-malonyltransferase [Armatimonadota bacterium]